MRITICGSLNVAEAMGNIAHKLRATGHIITLPFGAEKILAGEFSLDDIKKEKEQGVFHKRAGQYDAIRKHYKEVRAGDAILVVNPEKDGVQNYIGANTFLEIGFAHVLHKQIFVLYEIPEAMPYTEEIKTMQPIVLRGDLEKIFQNK